MHCAAASIDHPVADAGPADRETPARGRLPREKLVVSLRSDVLTKVMTLPRRQRDTTLLRWRTMSCGSYHSPARPMKGQDGRTDSGATSIQLASCDADRRYSQG